MTSSNYWVQLEQELRQLDMASRQVLATIEDVQAPSTKLATIVTKMLAPAIIKTSSAVFDLNKSNVLLQLEKQKADTKILDKVGKVEIKSLSQRQIYNTFLHLFEKRSNNIPFFLPQTARQLAQVPGRNVAPTLANSSSDIGYARVAGDAKPCAFCIVLISRGPVYKKSTVTTTRTGKLYHLSCKCTSVAVIRGSKDWDGYSQFGKSWALYENYYKGKDGLNGFRNALKDLDFDLQDTRFLNLDELEKEAEEVTA